MKRPRVFDGWVAFLFAFMVLMTFTASDAQAAAWTVVFWVVLTGNEIKAMIWDRTADRTRR